MKVFKESAIGKEFISGSFHIIIFDVDNVQVHSKDGEIDFWADSFNDVEHVWIRVCRYDFIGANNWHNIKDSKDTLDLNIKEV